MSLSNCEKTRVVPPFLLSVALMVPLLSLGKVFSLGTTFLVGSDTPASATCSASAARSPSSWQYTHELEIEGCFMVFFQEILYKILLLPMLGTSVSPSRVPFLCTPGTGRVINDPGNPQHLGPMLPYLILKGPFISATCRVLRHRGECRKGRNVYI